MSGKIKHTIIIIIMNIITGLSFMFRARLGLGQWLGPGQWLGLGFRTRTMARTRARAVARV